MDKTLATANALQRMLLQSLLMPWPAPAREPAVQGSPAPTVDAGETLPMHYRSEAFAEDLLEGYPAAR